MEHNDPVAVALGTIIRNTAEDQGMPLVRLAEKADMRRSTLYRYLDAERDMPLSVLGAIARALHVPATQLLHDAEERAASNADES